MDLVQPPLCLLCEAVQDRPGLCPECDPGRVATPCLACTGAGGISDPDCPTCALEPPGLPLVSTGRHRGSIRELVVAAKWSRLEASIPWLARRMAEACHEAGWPGELDAWSAVPRDPLRWVLRGVPLSVELGHELGRLLGLPRVPAPYRRLRRPQAGLSGDARRRNLDGCFRGDPWKARAWRGKKILLVDDVWTTGATIRACANAFRITATDVRACVVSIAPLKGTRRPPGSR